jgi:succinate-acetate transporter protein
VQLYRSILSTILHLYRVSGNSIGFWGVPTSRLSAGQMDPSSMAFLVLMFLLLLFALSAARGESVT